METPGCWRLLTLLCCLAPHRTAAHTGAGQLYPPTNITFGMKGLSCLFWKWTPTDRTASCSLSYTTEIVQAHTPPGGKDTKLHYAKAFDGRLDLNSNFTLKLYTECENRTSEATVFTSPLVTGNPRMMVNNMTCVWHYKEYVNCTWHPGAEIPPNVNYSLRYWFIEDHTCSPEENEQPTPLHTLLDEAKPCKNYTYQRGIPVGCIFKVEAVLGDIKELVAVVTDTSQDVKPYIYFQCINSIVKLKAPVISETKRTLNKTLFVSWNGFDTDLPFVTFEIQLSTSDNKDKGPQQFQDITEQSKEIPNANPDVTYRVKVRVRLTTDAICLFGNKNFLWSEWSEEKTIEVLQDNRILFILLLLLGSLLIIVATVFLLINMRRLLLLIFPRIPDPSKVISSDFQQWLKHGKSTYNEPKKEEVCVVSLLETPSLFSQVE